MTAQIEPVVMYRVRLNKTVRVVSHNGLLRLREQINQLVDTPTVSRLNTVLSVVCEYRDVPLKRVLRDDRSQRVKQCRHEAMYLARTLTESALSELSQFFKKTQGAIIHGCRAVRDAAETDERRATELTKLNGLVSAALERLKA